MKTITNKSKTGDAGALSRPPPVVHPGNEPEYDTEQITRRASEVTGVLEQILHEPPLPMAPSTGRSFTFPPIP